jgi:hypothetical protein
MITRGIVEEVIDRYKVRVRLPLLDGVDGGNSHKTKDELRTMVICTLPRVDLNLQVKDIVFVAFEDYDETNAVVLGCLFRENASSTLASINAANLYVEGGAELPRCTSIGQVTADEIGYLSGVNDNIQKQLNSIFDRLKTLEGK